MTGRPSGDRLSLGVANHEIGCLTNNRKTVAVALARRAIVLARATRAVTAQALAEWNASRLGGDGK
jgi:hypothetical protein